tara:strand:+ start:153 stop:407 length:255 start_codon:yes stop_codon:yes gene_type:complete
MSTSHLHFIISSIAVAITVIAFGLAIPSQAQADTNSVLYQQSMNITGKLTLLHEANGSQAKKCVMHRQSLIACLVTFSRKLEKY